ncbi:MFS transporter [Paracoccaceae bacterium Fryx2]|nr:MFS transporter [Paracoccaceae bacterium Fryx2]
MATRYIPLFLRHAPTPRVASFALLAGLEAAVRGILISVMPLTIYDAVRGAGAVSQIYFVVGVASLIWGLMVPWATRHVPRRWMYTAGACLYLVGMALAISGGPVAVPLALAANALATATVFVCFNAYVLDYITRADLGRSQSTQMLYAAAPWAVGPLLGVWLRSLWEPAPFVLAGVFACVLLTAFWILRLGNGKQIARARGPAPNPLAYLGRFFRQPRLIAGWLFAVLRSCGWWVYVVYLPIFCIEAGLSDKVGGIALSLSNALLFTTPFMLRLVYRRSLRIAVRAAFALCAATFIGATLVSMLPWATVALLMAGSFGLVLLDAAGGLPFLMAVKPSERTEMAAVYSSFRDVSGILTPGAAWLVLLAAPLAGIFAASGLGFAVAFAIAGRLHPRLGARRPSHGGTVPGE